jgi:glycosyltransferase A (GT-A) superfamily protein (DUF2064 family)
MLALPDSQLSNTAAQERLPKKRNLVCADRFSATDQQSVRTALRAELRSQSRADALVAVVARL